MFMIKQYLKMFLQNVFLPLVYKWYVRRPVRRGLAIFADAHHDEIPFSMRRVYERLCESVEQEPEGKVKEIQVFTADFDKLDRKSVV